MEKKINSITVTKYDYLIRNGYDEEVDDQGYPNHYSELDQEGRTLKEIKYSSGGDFEEMFEYSYDDKGNLLHEQYCLSEGEVAEKKTFVRDDAGRIRHVLKHYLDGSVDTIVYEYNDAGKPVRLITTTDEDEVDQVETFEWDNGELVGHQVTDGDGELISEPDLSKLQPNPTRITQNDQEQITMEEELDEDGEVYLTVNRSYDEDGRAAEVDVFFDGRGKSITRHYFLKYEYTYFE